MRYKTLEYENGVLKLIDQRRLPSVIEIYEARTYQEVEFAIADMVVRGAPAIGAAGAYGVFLAAKQFKDLPQEEFMKRVKSANQILTQARPTAVNLNWAIKRMEKVLEENRESRIEDIVNLLGEEAALISREDIEINKQMARNGSKIIPSEANILTHCNTGALATVDYGTALGVIREAFYSGKKIHVYVDETRPRLQGARLTAFELVEEGISATLIADSVAATLIRDGKVDLILVGADRIAANGDTANKIGTYMLSELALKFNVPFYIVAPISTIDFAISSGAEIKIEERAAEEVNTIKGIQVAPRGINVYNPAFDVTPAENITGIITENGIINKPFQEGIAALKE